MSQLKPIQFTDPVKAEDVTRFAQYVQHALQDTAADQLGVVSLKTTPSVNSYTVQASDQYVVVDALAGLFTVSLPTPKTRQVVTVIANTLTVVKRADGEAISRQPQLYITGPILGGNRSVTVVCTGSDWVQA